MKTKAMLTILALAVFLLGTSCDLPKSAAGVFLAGEAELIYTGKINCITNSSIQYSDGKGYVPIDLREVVIYDDSLQRIETYNTSTVYFVYYVTNVYGSFLALSPEEIAGEE